jgi:hypothetical protein
MRPQPRWQLAINSASVTNGQTATAKAIDTSPPGGPRARHLCLVVDAGVPNVVSNKPTVLKLQHSDTTDATNFSDISGTVGGTDFTIPNADTSNNNLYVFNVNLQGKKRYIRAQVAPQTTVTVAGYAALHWTDQAAATAVKAGGLALVEV